MEAFLSNTIGQFNNHIGSVRQLMNFDKLLVDFCISEISELDSNIRNNKVLQITNPRLLPTKTLNALKNIRQNDSLKGQYEGVYNQCIVLSVSYFTSTVQSIFKKSIDYALMNNPNYLENVSEDFKITMPELINVIEEGALGELLIKKKDISFQDMQSISRSFKTFFHFELTRDKDLNNIITAQAARHSLVHTLGIIDNKFLQQIRDADPRDIIHNANLDAVIRIKPSELDKLFFSMEIFISKISNSIYSNLTVK